MLAASEVHPLLPSRQLIVCSVVLSAARGEVVAAVHAQARPARGILTAAAEQIASY